VNPTIDPTFSFMLSIMTAEFGWIARAVRHGQAGRPEGSIPGGLANDPDSDRHGIVTPSAGLMNPNHFLAVAIRYLLANRPEWNFHSAVGKTLVSSCMIDRVVEKLGRHLYEVPVGFKWFVPGLLDGSVCFGGEESAGASSCAATAQYGPRTKTGRSWIFLPQRSPLEPEKIPACITVN